MPIWHTIGSLLLACVATLAGAATTIRVVDVPTRGRAGTIALQRVGPTPSGCM
jgi:hypothetical protein